MTLRSHLNRLERELQASPVELCGGCGQVVGPIVKIADADDDAEGVALDLVEIIAWGEDGPVGLSEDERGELATLTGGLAKCETCRTLLPSQDAQVARLRELQAKAMAAHREAA